MENLDFGIGGGLFLLGIGLIVLLVKILATFAGIYFISRAARPIIADWLGISGQLTGSGKYDALTFLVAWIFIVPLVITFFDLIPFVSQFYNRNYGGLYFYEFFLMAFTLFTYTKDLGTVTLKPFHKSLGIAYVYYGVSFIVSLTIDNLLRDFFKEQFFMLSYTFIKPVIFGIITILWVKKNYRKEEAGFKL